MELGLRPILFTFLLTWIALCSCWLIKPPAPICHMLINNIHKRSAMKLTVLGLFRIFRISYTGTYRLPCDDDYSNKPYIIGSFRNRRSLYEDNFNLLSEPWHLAVIDIMAGTCTDLSERWNDFSEESVFMHYSRHFWHIMTQLSPITPTHMSGSVK